VWDLLPEDILLLGFLVGDNLRGPPPNIHLFDPWETAWNSYGSLEFVGFPLDIVWDLLPEDILLLGFLVVDNLRGPPPNLHLFDPWETAWNSYRMVSESG
jgi:hypothetical protein